MSFLGHHNTTNEERSRGSGQEELMVFGYSCKLYRDDSKAMAEDSGVYLIPWMGDHSLMIDRYDCRGHLYDKGQFGLKSNLPRRWTAEEEAFEEMLDHERYMALDKDLREEDFRKEEEEKRLFEAMQDGYSAVGFKYTENKAEPVVPVLQPPPPPPLSSVIVDLPDDEDIYVPPAGLNLPNGIDTPSTNKLHNIIEKTALFISQQGTQMEIRIKINQKNNPYFAFMDFNDRLHPYYKHLLRAITSGNYTPKPQPVEQKVENVEKKSGEQQLEQRNDKIVEEQDDDDDDDEDSDGDYELHPLLMGSRTSSNTTTNSINQVTTSANGHSGPAAVSTQSYADHYQQQAAYAYYMDQSAMYNTGLMPSIPLNTMIEDPPHPPPPDIQPIIDKLAEYVAKHGHAFEDTVKRNGDPRLQFINSSHEYYKYFMLRKNLYRQKFLMEEMTNENKKPNQVITQDLPCAAKETTDVQTLKEDGSVGFKIATKEEKVMSGVYLGSASDDEGEGEEGDKEGEESSEAVVSEVTVEDKDAEGDSALKKTTTVITTTSLPKPSVMEEQEKTKSERRKKAAMFVEQLRQKRAEKIAKETDIVGPLLPHEYKYCNRKYKEPSPAIERVTSNTDNDDEEEEDGDNPSAKRMKTVTEDEDDDYFIEEEEPAPSTRMRTRLTVKSIPRH